MPHATALYLFFKAYQPGLFDQQVQVSGHVTKRGTVVAPYHSTRKKRPEPPPGEDLFAQADRKAKEADEKKAKEDAERKAKEEAEKAEREAAERKVQPRSAPDPAANRAAMKENEIKRPMAFFHGTAAKSQIKRFKPGITFLSPDPENARQFAENPLLSGSSDGHKGGGKPRVIEVTVPPGRIKDLTAEVNDAIFNDEDPDLLIAEEAKKALADGFKYIKFMHPGHDGEDFFALVSIDPETLEVADREAAERKAKEAEAAKKKSPLDVTGRISLEDIKVGDIVHSRGDKRVAGTGGEVIKASPKTLILKTQYMGNPLEIKISRGNLTGEVRVLRDGKLYSTTYQTPEEKAAQEVEAERAQAQEAERKAAEMAEFMADRIKSVQGADSIGDLTARTKVALGDIADLSDKIGYDGVAEYQSKIREVERAKMGEFKLEKAARLWEARYLFLKAAA